ncbi:hypothetical protein KSP39_PZI018080 [Platanthera zijinensis]|uniref:Integrase catalytic domain-containing protein n=1 Tax=Platanthera zijinensis TaxID=2320716 RepID=A0AAP0FZA6_9ASPA
MDSGATHLITSQRPPKYLLTAHPKFITVVYGDTTPDRKTQNIIGKGRLSNGFYLLDIPPSALSVVSSVDWHRRLGYAPLQILKKALSDVSLHEFTCESCIFGRQHRSSFHPTCTRSDTPLSLVHSDIWRPYKTPSMFGYRYFVTFMDDYSRLTWLYLLCDRVELTFTFRAFITETHTQFSSPLKIIRTDNAHKYTSRTFFNLCTEFDILHQTSCVYTPQQNGVAKRKNRYFLDVARSLMIQMQVLIYTGTSLCLQHVTSSIACLPPCSILPLHSVFCFLPNPYLLSRLVCLDVLVTSTIWVHPQISLPHVPAGVCLWATLELKKAMCYSPTIDKVVVSADVIFLKTNHFMFHLQLLFSLLPYLILPFLSRLLYRPSFSLHSWHQFHLNHLFVYTLVVFRPLEPYNSYLLPVLSRGLTIQHQHLPLIPWQIMYLCIAYLHLSSSLHSLYLPSIYLTQCKRLFFTQGGVQLMEEEMTALWANQTWDLVPLLPGQFCVCCKWVFAVKHAPNGTVDRLKARLMARGFTQQHGIDYDETFSSVTKLNSVRVLISLAFHRNWPLHRLDIKIAFLNDDLLEKVARRPDGLVLSQRKYCLDLLRHAGYSWCKLVEIPMDVNHKLCAHGSDSDSLLTNPEYYRRPVGKLIYLTVTRLDISFVVEVVSRFMHSPRISHLQAVERILRYLNTAPGEGFVYKSSSSLSLIAYSDADYAGSFDDRRSTTGFCTYFGGNLITWRSKKQSVVARSSAEAEYRAMTAVVSELTWLESFLGDLGVSILTSNSPLPESVALLEDIVVEYVTDLARRSQSLEKPNEKKRCQAGAPVGEDRHWNLSLLETVAVGKDGAGNKKRRWYLMLGSAVTDGRSGIRENILIAG